MVCVENPQFFSSWLFEKVSEKNRQVQPYSLEHDQTEYIGIIYEE